jgi:hypothetical protein
MDRIYQNLLSVKTEFPSINFEWEITQPCLPSDVEMALRSVVRAYESSLACVHEAEQIIKRTSEQYQSFQAKSNDELARERKGFSESISTLERENEKWKALLEGKTSLYEIREQKQEDRMARIYKEHQDRVDDYKLQIQHLNTEIALSKERQDGEANCLKLIVSTSEASAELAMVSTHLETQLSQAQTVQKDTIESYKMHSETMINQHEEEKLNIERRFADKKTWMHQDLQDQKNEMTRRHQINKRAVEEKLRVTRDKFETQLKSIKARLEQEPERNAKETEAIRKSYDAEKQRMREAFELEKTGFLRELNETVESLKGALVQRDYFQAMSDHELANRFQVISLEVDEFARVVWEKGRESSWPLPGQSFRKSGNERRAKQYIMQNTLWVILYERIFCTPFRVLGSEGKSLETKWIETFGQGSLLYKYWFVG